jgi:hypothetical protein
LLRVVLFLILMPVVLALPPLWFAVFAFFAFTLHSCRKG